MKRFVAALATLLITVMVIAVLHSALLQGFDGNPWLLVFAGVFWMFLVSSALIIDRRS